MKANEFVREEHLDHEVRMAKADLMALAQDSMQLLKLLNNYASEERGIPGWVASKITKAQDYINSVHKTLTHDAVDGSINEISEKTVNPYAVGMAQAMKSTGDKPPLKKSTIRKAHKIAKAVANETASAGSTSAGMIASVANPHVTGYKGPKPKKQKPTDNALDMKGTSIFGGPLKRP